MVTSMLEKAIEIEGLLRIIRDGNPLPETYILLNIKAAELAEQAVALEEKADAPQTETPHADFIMASPEPQTPTVPEVVFNIEKKVTNEAAAMPEVEEETGISLPTMLPPEDLALIEEDDILLSFEEPAELTAAQDEQEPEVAGSHSFEMAAFDEGDAVSTPDASREDIDLILEAAPLFSDDSHATEKSLIDTHADTASGLSQDPLLEISDHTPEEDDTPVQSEPTIHSVKSGETKRHVKLKSSFSLNDRFLYARELFNGNMKMFDSTLDFLEGIEDYSIIEDYFYSELEWNPEDSNVAAFMEILRPNFKE